MYALDTNIIIHLLINTPSVCERFDNAIITEKAKIVIPPYVNFEILRGFKYVSAPRKEKTYQQLCACCDIGEMNRNVWERAADIYADLRCAGFTVNDADILIAAFSVINKFTLVTGNTKDFENIDGLQITNWTT
jgi:tRNA(fMet)-specific endonuclease VapC